MLINTPLLYPQELTIGTLDLLPRDLYSLTLASCTTLTLQQPLSHFHKLRTVTIVGVGELKLPKRALLAGLRRLTSFAVEDTKISVIPSFSLGRMNGGVGADLSIVFRNVEIGTISSGAFSGLGRPRRLQFTNCRIGEVEPNSFGRGRSQVDNLSINRCQIGSIKKNGIWFQRASVVHMDQLEIGEVVSSAVRIDNSFFFYLTRSRIKYYEVGGVVVKFRRGVMIDKNVIGPLEVGGESSNWLFQVEASSDFGDHSFAPFIHFTSNVLTTLLPARPFFPPKPTINIAVPNNTFGECSCDTFTNFMHTLSPTLDPFALAVHQAAIKHGLCILEGESYSIGCSTVIHPQVFSNGRTPSKIPVRGSTNKNGSRTKIKQKANETVHQSTPRTSSEATQIFSPDTPSRHTTFTTSTTPRIPPPPQPSLLSFTSPTTTVSRAPPLPNKLPIQSSASPTSSPRLTQAHRPAQTLSQTKQPEITEPPTTHAIMSPVSSSDSFYSRPTLPLGLEGIDIETIWNEIYAGVFSQRLRRPLEIDSRPEKSMMAFRKLSKPRQFLGTEGEKQVFFTPR
ncbi:hypothetical protein Pmani_017963 [Petrolisthes manimaculis]|uniref:Uncharacterized protein n=1 Tax=Petrolisthes manimaculis TaxID=1843537 RepID=A0AAE1PNZ2_9EUCA|nr:hypothetical protein Pmani_017963 [Petrolisthes manimaculis]